MDNQVTITLTVEHLPDDNLWKELVGDNQPITPTEFLHRLFSARPGERVYIPSAYILHPK
jgi:hypothetical protein